MKCSVWSVLLALAIPSLGLAQKASNTTPATEPKILGSKDLIKRSAVKFVDRIACSSLCQAKQPMETAFKVIAEMGYHWVDLSCMNWAAHVNVPRLTEDFETEAGRIETALKRYDLQVANLTFDSVDMEHFESYAQQFEAVLKLAVRLKARLINLMAASPKVDRQSYVEKLRRLEAMAEKPGVILTLETHCNQITELPSDAAWLCYQVPGLGLTLDPSHYYAGTNQGLSFDQLIPLVQGTGFRAGGRSWAEIQLPWGQGPINFQQVVQKLEKAGYTGFYVAEYIEGFSQTDAIAESRNFLEWAKKQ
jgi:sugar phosphate isomerase/epimerase